MNKRGESSKSGLFSQLMNSDLSVFTCPPLREERLGLKTKNEFEFELCFRVLRENELFSTEMFSPLLLSLLSPHLSSSSFYLLLVSLNFFSFF